MQCGNDSAHGILARLHTHFLAHCNTDSRCNLTGHKRIPIVDSAPYSGGIVADDDGAGRAGSGTLTAADTRRLGKRYAECSRDDSLGAAERKVDGADILDLVAFADTVAAEDALARITDDARRGNVSFHITAGISEADIIDAELSCQRLQLAVSVIAAGCTVAAVLSEQKFQDVFPVFPETLCIGAYLHAWLRNGGAGSHETASLVLNHAHSAGTVYGKIGMVAEGRHFDAGFADQLEKVTFVTDFNGNSVNFHHIFKLHD